MHFAYIGYYCKLFDFRIQIKLWCNICEQDDLQVVSSLVASLKKEHKSKLLKGKSTNIVVITILIVF